VGEGGTPLYWLCGDDPLNMVWFFKLVVINRLCNSSPFPIFFEVCCHIQGIYCSFKWIWLLSVVKTRSASQNNYSNQNSAQSDISFVINRVYKFDFFFINRVAVTGSQPNIPQAAQAIYLYLFLASCGFLLAFLKWRRRYERGFESHSGPLKNFFSLPRFIFAQYFLC